MTVRIIGTHPGDVTQLRLHLAGVTANSATLGPEGDLIGPELAVTSVPAGTSLFLQTDATTYTVGKFHLPEAGEGFAVSVSFSLGGARRGDLGHDLELCTGPLSFRFHRDHLSPARCHVLLLLDVDRSVVADGAGFAFVPQFRVAF